MSQKTTGLYRLTQISAAYQLFQWLLGSTRARARLVDGYLRPRAGMRVLDLGCGPATVRSSLGDVVYFGIDANPDHIASAQAEHGDKGVFVTGDFASLQKDLGGTFDLVLCLGLMHHLEDARVGELAKLARSYLAVGGRFVAVDPVFAPGQPRIARWLAAADSGQNVREAAGYHDLVAPAFGQCVTTIRHDMLRIPYSHCITTATAQ